MRQGKDQTDNTLAELTPGETIVWYQQRLWGGKQGTIAVFVGYRGKASARIQTGDRERTVRTASLAALNPTQQED